MLMVSILPNNWTNFNFHSQRCKDFWFVKVAWNELHVKITHLQKHIQCVGSPGGNRYFFRELSNGYENYIKFVSIPL